MKKYMLLFIMFCAAQTSKAQQCVNQVNTHPDSAQNLNLPWVFDINLGQEVRDTRFLNAWYWWAQPNRTDIINGAAVPWPMGVPLNNMGMNPSSGAPATNYGNTMNSIQHANYSGFYDHLSWSKLTSDQNGVQRFVNEVMLPENGWELVSQNRGFFPNLGLYNWDEDPFDMIDARAVPFLLFYNKYTETARIYWRYGENTTPAGSINAAEIIITYPDANAMSGMLRVADGFDRPLDQNTKIRRVAALVPRPGSSQRFFSADFKMAYDPCVCKNQSQLHVDFKFITTATLSAMINALGTTEQITTAQLLAGEDFLNAFANNSSNGPDEDGGGYFIYKHMADLLDDYIAKYAIYEQELQAAGEHNAKVKRNKLILSIAKIALTNLLPGGTAASAVKVSLANAVKILGPDAEVEVDANGESILTKKSADKFWKTTQGVIKESATLFQGMSMFKEMDDPSKPFMPTVTATQMKMQGSIEMFDFQKISVLKTPGSLGSDITIANTSMNAYPIYNEALGVFALLTTPTYSVSEEQKNFSCQYEYFDTTMLVNPSIDATNPNWQNITYSLPRLTENSKHVLSRQIRLAAPLEYYFNPVLDISDVEINASIIANVTLTKTTHLGLYNVYTDFTLEPQNQVNYDFPIPQSATFNYGVSNSVSLGQSFDIESYSVPIDALNNFGITVCLSSHYNSLPLNLMEPFTINPFTNVPTVNPQFCTLAEQGLADISIKFSDIRLKLEINVEYEDEIHQYDWNSWNTSEGKYTESSTDNASFVYVRTFNSHSFGSTAPYNPNFAPGGSGDLGPLNFTLTNTVFDGNPVLGCHLNGNMYTCSSWQPITIQGVIGVAQGFQVTVQSGTEINMVPLHIFDDNDSLVETLETILPTEAVLQIVPILNLNNPMPPQISTQVSTFCENKYKANILRQDIQNMLDSLAQLNPTVELSPDPIQFILFPNPTTGASQTGIYLPELATISITIIDLSGKVVGSPVENVNLAMGENIQNLQTESLLPGIYFVCLVVNGEKFMQRLVKL